ncbi:c-type cytochrome [Pseudomonas purpurea]|uniref:c-type cytochrome n=1 Tax=Pseudomonas purpurea TaxID=3136737 RepID=UPI0032674180
MIRHRMMLSSLMLVVAGGAHAVEGKNVYTQGGAQPGATACFACHGGDGLGMPAAGFPRLAGTSAAYLSKQLLDFRAGTRVSPVMQPVAKALSEAEIQAVATTLAAMPAPQTPLVNRTASPKNLGETLALRGAWDRSVPECVMCHGPGGIGVGSAFPPLAAQPASYLVAQLNAWRDGTRHNDPDDLMGHIAKSLSADEISAVADYFATLGSQEVKP